MKRRSSQTRRSQRETARTWEGFRHFVERNIAGTIRWNVEIEASVETSAIENYFS